MQLTLWYLDSSSKVDLLQPGQRRLLQGSPLHLAEGKQGGVRQPHAPPTAVCPATAALHITRDVIIPHTHAEYKILELTIVTRVLRLKEDWSMDGISHSYFSIRNYTLERAPSFADRQTDGQFS
ncbi:hypothetical protein SFRURICE_000214 [Spodoptera frugiperda]|nr:hypothetical protein SFRURICE_000214 [Spodoptera frugiperda]